jgi:hypothetical protein
MDKILFIVFTIDLPSMRHTKAAPSVCGADVSDVGRSRRVGRSPPGAAARWEWERHAGQLPGRVGRPSSNIGATANPF